MKISREAQVVLVCTAVYVILSFFAWYQSGSFSANEWDNIGVFAALLAVVMLLWEIWRALDANLSLGSLSAPTVSLLLALGLLFFTIATIIPANYLNWPAWIGLILSIFIAGIAYLRAQNEGIALPRLAVPTSAGRPHAAPAASPPEPAQPMEPVEPVEPADDPGPETSEA